MLRELLGIELPIIQAPMAGVQGSALAIAVSNAGGLGSLPCAMLTPEALRTELAAVRDGGVSRAAALLCSAALFCAEAIRSTSLCISLCLSR